jgi:hypothetical protein
LFAAARFGGGVARRSRLGGPCFSVAPIHAISAA